MKILDCTLRDGGYYTNWDFETEIQEVYFQSLNQLPIDYLEIGYRNHPKSEYFGEYFYTPIYRLEKIKEFTNKKLVIILNEKDVRPEHVSDLLQPCIGLVAMVRIALDPQYLGRALHLAEAIKKLGFEVGFNVMYMSKWAQYGDFIQSLKDVSGVADYFYMVDSYGGVYPEDVINTIHLIREKTDIALGFHGHNNLELALINTFTAMQHGVKIVDATITGMGRGAGNLKTELLLTALNAKEGLEFDFNALAAVTQKFEDLREHYGWGTNLPYMVSGGNSLPQKDVMEWVSKRFYSVNSILLALDNQKKKLVDNQRFEIFSPDKSVKNALIIGGGPNVKRHLEAIMQYLLAHPDLVIIHASSKNASLFSKVKNQQIFCLVGNEGHRLENSIKAMGGFQGTCVLPPYPRQMGTYVPESLNQKAFELKQISFTDIVKDAHTVLALQTCIDLGIEHIYFTGYDGYMEGNVSQLEKSLSDENESILSDFKIKQKIKLKSLTPTKYKELELTSVYQFIF